MLAAGRGCPESEIAAMQKGLDTSLKLMVRLRLISLIWQLRDFVSEIMKNHEIAKFRTALRNFRALLCVA